MTQQFQQLEKRKFMSTRGLHMSVHSGVIHRSQHMETTQHLQTAQGSEMQKHSVWYDSATGANCELTTMCKNQRHKEKDTSHKRHSAAQFHRVSIMQSRQTCSDQKWTRGCL